MGKPSENRTITIYDIAKEAGVSPATVSRVLTKSANVRSEKREKVEHLIAKYNFTPNALAKGLSDTQSRVIGIVAMDVCNPYYAAMVVSCENAARAAGYTIMLCNMAGNGGKQDGYLEIMRQQRVAAVIQLGGKVDDLVSDEAYVERVNQLMQTIPMVVTGKLDGTHCYEVKIDSLRAAELSVEHLLKLGHRKIALVGGHKYVTSTYDKYTKYMELLQAYGVEYQKEYVVDGDYDYETGYDAMNQLLRLEDIPTAVVAINDFAASGVVRSISEHGYQIPGDISVVSYDNTFLSEMLIPKLTSVDYDYEKFGKTLVDTAVAAAKGESVPRQQKITPFLVVRESSGAPRC